MTKIRNDTKYLKIVTLILTFLSGADETKLCSVKNTMISNTSMTNESRRDICQNLGN